MTSNLDSSIFEEAANLVDGDRQAAYGDPRVNLSNIAASWNGILRAKAQRDGLVGPVVELTAYEVSLMMAALKLMRAAFKPSRDNAVDAAAYVGLAHRVAPEAAKPEAPKDPAAVVTLGGTTTAPAATPTWGTAWERRQACRLGGKSYCEYAQRCYETEYEHEQIHPDHP